MNREKILGRLKELGHLAPVVRHVPAGAEYGLTFGPRTWNAIEKCFKQQAFIGLAPISDDDDIHFAECLHRGHQEAAKKFYGGEDVILNGGKP